MCVLVILVPILINKDVSEPSYNALNFMICTILDLHQPNIIIIIIGILEKRKWRSREATQAISGRSKIWAQIPKFFPLDYAYLYWV